MYKYKHTHVLRQGHNILLLHTLTLTPTLILIMEQVAHQLAQKTRRTKIRDKAITQHSHTILLLALLPTKIGREIIFFSRAPELEEGQDEDAEGVDVEGACVYVCVCVCVIFGCMCVCRG
jgi:hypothetical protein